MNILKNVSLSLALAPLTLAIANAAPHYITVGNDLASELIKANPEAKIIKESKNFSLLEVEKSDKIQASVMAHEKFHRCGGFFSYETLTEALGDFDLHNDNEKSMLSFQDYSLTEEDSVKKAMAQTSEINIRSTIIKLSSYHNRYYKSTTGVESSNWIADEWKKLVAHRSDAKVSLFNHTSWPQPSVILKIEGESPETIIIGGHADSIAGFWNRGGAHAPGADDNASGIATITEVIRVLMESNYRPKKTLAFMAYAAEEVGLLGSKEIAKKYKDDGITVAGVLQLDMTNFKGSDWDIALMQDYTNNEQNAFVGSLIDTYLPGLKWGYDKCGYGCSDHASWHLQGFPASIPFEAKKNDMNHRIHTNKDTLETMGGTAAHAEKFAKLAIAYTLELSK
ncbi:peptidase, M28 family [Bacteriovorax sp. BSW11_IV]|uniref:M20/M25/M40 family metallo-hydrolase n=1 Tax=Bacteriovorax sp. BSW11_IV TaxID=1353529 RepID=UPI00038A0047|nr:M20/M25/M40 family metallo-hydrolase [Bacteriovorax sp. BSW11_IV]EQC47791.1 peptidase, M28 family [Bacteriovorax sp. BSW11_IV]